MSGSDHDNDHNTGAPDPGEDIYGLVDDDIPPPALPGHVTVALSPDELIDRIAADLVIHSENCVREFGDFQLALGLGPWSMKLYERLMYDPNYRRLPWRRTHLWLVDERRVEFDDDESHFRQLRETIVDHSDIPPQQVHPIFPTSDDPAGSYEAVLRETLAWREKGQDRLDFVLLEMDAAGCAGSLIDRPGTEAWSADGCERLVRTTEDPTPGAPEHISMTPHFLNAARFIAILVSGTDKRDAVGRVSLGCADELPVSGLHPHQGELRWYLDLDACPVSE